MDLKTKFKELQKKQKAYAYVINLAGWDANTETPKHAFPYMSDMMSVINGEMFNLMTSQEYQEVVNGLFKDLNALDDLTKREVKKAKKDLDKIVKIPKEEYVAYQKLISDTQIVWEEAKKNNDFTSFQPNLEQIIASSKRILEYIGYKGIPYNELLDDFEEGYTIEDYDKFFDTLRSELVPFVKEVLNSRKRLNEEFISKKYPKNLQKDFVEYLMKVLDFNFDRGGLKESVHPFTWNTHSKDVRFTVRYLEDFMFSSIFAGIHELGHATYEQQIDEKLDYTNLNSGTSSGIHESQSRFYENIIGRSKVFWEVHYPKLKEMFPKQLEGVSVNDFYLGVNKVEASMIRVEADELTYPMHIMIRYEIEKMLFSNQLEVKDLPKVWNDKMVEYLGIEPLNDSEGVLQDVHWSVGLFGYFPTYALGSAYAAQFYYSMIKDIDFEKTIKNNDIKIINKWLKEKIHIYGSSKSPKELLKEVTGEDFNPKYYIKFLKEKYSKIFL